MQHARTRSWTSGSARRSPQLTSSEFGTSTPTSSTYSRLMNNSYVEIGGSATPDRSTTPQRIIDRMNARLFYFICAGTLFIVFSFAVNRHSSQPFELSKLSLSSIPIVDTLLRAAGRDEVEAVCNPFQMKGRLLLDAVDPSNNVWQPYDPTCEASTLMRKLYNPIGQSPPLIAPSKPTREFLPWFMNRTVVIHGDSIDRFHLKDFCEMAGGRLFFIDNQHEASPEPYQQPVDATVAVTAESQSATEERRRLEQIWEARPLDGQELTNPWVCDVEEYGTTFISVFTWGLKGGERYYGTERWYYPPSAWIDRLDFIMKPLLAKLAVHLNRPQITTPDLVEINAGFWSLRKYSEEDFMARGYTRPYPEDSEIPYQSLGAAREIEWEKDARKAVKAMARKFPGKDGDIRAGPPILWRVLHHPRRHNYAPYNRVFALDSLARKMISDLQIESTPQFKRLPMPEEIRAEEESLDEDLGLDSRLRLNEWGALMLGQEHHFRDLLHPAAVLSYVWADIILWELKRAVSNATN